MNKDKSKMERNQKEQLPIASTSGTQIMPAEIRNINIPTVAEQRKTSEEHLRFNFFQKTRKGYPDDIVYYKHYSTEKAEYSSIKEFTGEGKDFVNKFRCVACHLFPANIRYCNLCSNEKVIRMFCQNCLIKENQLAATCFKGMTHIEAYLSTAQQSNLNDILALRCQYSCQPENVMME